MYKVKNRITTLVDGKFITFKKGDLIQNLPEKALKEAIERKLIIDMENDALSKVLSVDELRKIRSTVGLLEYAQKLKVSDVSEDMKYAEILQILVRYTEAINA